MKYKVSTKDIRASKELCVTLLDVAGGASAIANSLEWDRQYIQMCYQQGYVPLVRVYEVGKLLGVSPYSLSYLKFLEALGEETPEFKKVVEGTPLLPAEKTRILEIVK